ncbi:MAG: ribose 5-phosphate isomerase B [Bryobacteraceae bacterium]|nr:ribose 5-phosphate isomerase B [Bryobacteraceae bacterium]MDW8379992.1 ribose 5-phosphate isomerase B [Bryobacterales bacterium]
MRRVITTQEIPPGGDLRIPIGSIVTPAARDLARERGVRIQEVKPEELDGVAPAEKTIALGADHGGFEMKEHLKPLLVSLGFALRDVGIHEPKTADYPDIAHAVAELVASGKALQGMIVDGAGIGSAMVANKVPGIRAALCYDKASARNSREHNHANVLTLGGRFLTLSLAEEIVRTWLATPYGGGRHEARVDQIKQIEKRYRTWTPQS